MTATLERLRCLRRQTGQGASPAALPPAPMDAVGMARVATHAPLPAVQTIDDLRRLLRVRAPAITPRAATPADRTLPGEEIAPGLRLIETVLACDPPPARIDLHFTRDGGDIAARDALCFDTETTGLAGGTGTRAFLIGSARWRDDGLHLCQWLMTTLAAEGALLRAFADSLDPGAALISYNGRSYDAPLLAARYRLARQPDPLHGRAHIDLLQPARRRWRGRWENCRLATIERRVLGVVREDDLPGSEAPGAWLRYLRGSDAGDLHRVLDHNRQDLVSLALLLSHLASTAVADGAHARSETRRGQNPNSND
jgi:uncharacterized protein YprB with RNaseH-like and TPR domain